MISRILIAILNAIITFVILSIIIALLVMVGFSAITVLSPFVVIISVIVGILTFLGAIPNYWTNIFK
jgi:hypothetical protein